MKIKRLCVLAVLSLASAASGAGDLEDKYYAGLNFGAGWGGGFVVKPSVVFGYHHDKNSKFELEVLTNMSDITKSTRKIGASLLANYRFYPDLDIDPVKLYVSGGLGGHLQIIPFGFGGSSNEAPTLSQGVTSMTAAEDSTLDESTTPDEPPTQNKKKPKDTTNLSLVDKILSSISYKLKVGVDYEIAPQIVGAVGITAGEQLSGIKALQIPDATLEVGIRYNF